MTFNEFHNALRILVNIDMDEFCKAVPDEKQWAAFAINPHGWFIRACDAHAKPIWKIVEERNAGTKTSG